MDSKSKVPRKSLLNLDVTGSPTSFRLAVTNDICVGPPGNVFLFGGVGHAAAVAAMKQVVGRELICSTAQFLSFARRDQTLDIAVSVSLAGRSISRATAVARIDDKVIYTVCASFGNRPDQLQKAWTAPPAMPRPEACVDGSSVWPPQEGGLNKRVEIRVAPSDTRARSGAELAQRSGGLQLWIRTIENLPVDATMLAIFGDFVPAGIAAATGRRGGGNSLDNVLRLCTPADTRWVLCDIQVNGVDRGFAHGEIRMFAENGALLAVGSQTVVLQGAT